MCSRGCRRCCMSKLCWGSILVIGVVSIVLGLTIFTVIIDKQVEKNLDLWNLDSEGRKNFVSHDRIFDFYICTISSYIVT